MLAELLRRKGYVVLGAHWVLAPTNWPPHVRMVRSLAWSEPFGRLAGLTPRSLRPIWATFWDRPSHPDRRDRDALLAFVDAMARKAAAGELDQAPSPAELHRPIAACAIAGRLIPREFPDQKLRMRAEPSRCSGCGTCVRVCSEGVVTQPVVGGPPRIGPGCTGCYACFNACPAGALVDALSPDGLGQYKGPPRDMRELFRD